MGTTWTVKVEAGERDPDVLRRQIAARLEELEQQLSTYRPGSALSRFNACGHTEWFPIPAELAQVADESRRIAQLTGGAFDPTVEPLVRLWGFGPGPRPEAPPTAEAIARVRQRVDWRQLEVRASPPALRRTRLGVTADFSSAGKGFAADAVSLLLSTEGLPRHLAQIGGDVRAGAAPSGRGRWPVAIEQPQIGAPGFSRVIDLADRAISTSGNYRNFFPAGGERLGHIIDPRTGRPAQGALAAVTVVHASAATSSALATGLFALGAEEGLRLARAEGLAGLFVVRRGDELVPLATPEFAALTPTPVARLNR
jgi:thiamine biosynthesis lipoprotein